MNNVKNDERFFVADESKKPFSVKLSEEEYKKEFNKSFEDSLYRFQWIDPINEDFNDINKKNLKDIDDVCLLSLINVKDSLELHIKKYLRNCLNTYPKVYDFKKVKKQLDEFEIQLKEVENQIEKRKAIVILKDEYDVKKKIIEKSPLYKSPLQMKKEFLEGLSQ